METTTRFYLLCKALALGVGVQVYSVAICYGVAGLLGVPWPLLPLAGFGLRDLTQLYALCGFTHCDELRHLLLGWIACAWVTVPLMLLGEWLLRCLGDRRVKGGRMPWNAEPSAGAKADALYSSRALTRRGSVHFKLHSILLLWLVGMDLRVALHSISFFVRDEQLRLIETLGERPVPQHVIRPQGFGRRLRSPEMLFECATALLWGLPWSPRRWSA